MGRWIRSQTSPRCLAAGPRSVAASPDMVPWMTWLKLGREMWTHPGKANADKFTKV